MRRFQSQPVDVSRKMSGSGAWCLFLRRGPISALAVAGCVLCLASVAFAQLPPAPIPKAPIAIDVPADRLRQDLARAHRELNKTLNDEWKTYLKLPAEVFATGDPPHVGALRGSLKHYDVVRSDARYTVIARMPAFQQTRARLVHYLAELQSPSAEEIIPPTPLPPQEYEVIPQRRVDVDAPFVDVHTSDGRVRVRAPFVKVDTYRGRIRIRAPYFRFDR